MYGSSQQVDDADEGLIVAISSGPALGSLKDTVERFKPGVAMTGLPAGQDGLAIFGHGLQRLANRPERIDAIHHGGGSVDKPGQSPHRPPARWWLCAPSGASP